MLLVPGPWKAPYVERCQVRDYLKKLNVQCGSSKRALSLAKTDHRVHFLRENVKQYPSFSDIY